MTRGARLIALSVGGGAAITLLGATAAHAGDAESTGNQSATEAGQTLEHRQGRRSRRRRHDGTVSNLGAAGANTGVNGAEEVEVTTGNARVGRQPGPQRPRTRAPTSPPPAAASRPRPGRPHPQLGRRLRRHRLQRRRAVATGNADAWGNRSWSTVGQQLVDRRHRRRAAPRRPGRRHRQPRRGLGRDRVQRRRRHHTGNATAGGNESGTTHGAGRHDHAGGARRRPRRAAVPHPQRRRRPRQHRLQRDQGDESTNLAQVFYNGVLDDESTENDD